MTRRSLFCIATVLVAALIGGMFRIGSEPKYETVTPWRAIGMAVMILLWTLYGYWLGRLDGEEAAQR